MGQDILVNTEVALLGIHRFERHLAGAFTHDQQDTRG